MIVYKRKTRSLARYLFGAIVFILGLTLAVADVYGLQMPFGQSGTGSYDNYIAEKNEIAEDKPTEDEIIIISDDTNENQGGETDTIPTSVPEPSSIILLASGLGLLSLAKKKRK